MTIVDGLHALHATITVCLVLWLWALHRRPSRRDARVTALEAEVDTMQGTLRKLAGRFGKAARDSSPETPAPSAGELSQQPGESYIDWKRRARALIAKGVKPQ